MEIHNIFVDFWCPNCKEEVIFVQVHIIKFTDNQTSVAEIE